MSKNDILLLEAHNLKKKISKYKSQIEVIFKGLSHQKTDVFVLYVGRALFSGFIAGGALPAVVLRQYTRQQAMGRTYQNNITEVTL